MIRKIGGKYYVYSKKGKRLSKGYSSRAEAERRLKQIEYFKHKGKMRRDAKKKTKNKNKRK